MAAKTELYELINKVKVNKTLLCTPKHEFTKKSVNNSRKREIYKNKLTRKSVQSVSNRENNKHRNAEQIY